MAYVEIPYNDSRELIEEILQRLAEGESLLEICRDIAKNDPAYPTLQPHHIRRWAREFPAFGDQYALALQDGADALIDQTRAIAETPTPTEIITEKWSGGRNPKLQERTVRIVDNLERDKLRILVRQYRARMQSPRVREAERPRVGIEGSGDGGAVAVEIRGGLPEAKDIKNPLAITQSEDPST